LTDFVVGSCNRVAHAAALSTVEMPGQGANPLVLHGPVGTGKTHLLEGIYTGLRKQHPECRLHFVTAEDFTNRFVQAMRRGQLSGFRKRFRAVDGLLLDDLDFLAGKRATQEEFLHTLDSLLREGRQVVVTCDAHPRLAGELSPEVIDRLMGGAVWSLAPPDPDTRRTLLEGKAAQLQLTLSKDVLRYLALNLRGNVRELEGAIHSLNHYRQLMNRPVDLAMAREALGELLRHALRVVHLADIDRAVCGAFRLETGALHGKERAWSVSHPRMVAMYLARKLTAAAYSEIGRYFGGRNHSTVVAAEKKIRRCLEEDTPLVVNDQSLSTRAVVEIIERTLQR
jgi:chromosomal replication initiator protein